MLNIASVLAVIMGGGRGTRLYPLTRDRCKPAVPLAGKYRLVDIPISNCLNSGINRIFLLSQFNTASLHRHIQSTYRFDQFGAGFVDILSAEQTETGDDWYQGTADAVRRNLMHLGNYEHDLVLILSGDQLYRQNFRKIIDQHIRQNADVTVSAIPFPRAQVEGLGLMRVNDDLTIAEFAEKPKDPKVVNRLVMSPALMGRLRTPRTESCCLASMGIYVFNRAVLRDALDNSMTDFGKEIIPGLLGKKSLQAYIYEGYWEDIGTVGAFFEANLQLADPLPKFNFFDSSRPIYTHSRYLPASKVNNCTMECVVVADGCIIIQARLHRCVIGLRSVIRENVVLDEVVMMGADYIESDAQRAENRSLGKPDIGIGSGTVLSRCIIDKNARIGAGVRLSPDGKPGGFTAPGVMVRDNVLVVMKNAVIPDGTVI